MQIDIDASIRSIVADAVNASLAPYRGVLDRMAAFVGEAPVRRGPGRPAQVAEPVAAARARPRRNGGGGRTAATNLVGKFSEGQSVQYKQGRGTFDARIVAIDAEKGALTLERVTDGKKVVRPASKVIAA